MRQAIVRPTHGDDDTGWAAFAALGFATFVLPGPKIGVDDDLTWQVRAAVQKSATVAAA